MRRRLLAFLFILMFTMLFGVMFILFVTGGIMPGAGETEKLISKEEYYLSQKLRGQYGEASVQAARLSETISAGIEARLSGEGLTVSDLKTHPELLESIVTSQLNNLLLSLSTTDCSGVFMTLDATVNPSLTGAEYSRAGLYIRNSEPNMSRTDTNKLLLRGFPTLAIQGSLSMQARWDLEFNIQNQPFYSEPLAAYEQNPSLPLSRLYYWCFQSAIPDLDEEVMLCSIPLIDSTGRAFGVCGFEISEMNFMQKNDPDDSLYANIVCILAETNGDSLDFGKALFAGNSAVYRAFSKDEGLTYDESVKGMTLYSSPSVRLVGLYEDIGLYTSDSPFAGQKFIAAVAIPKSDFDGMQTTRNIQFILLFAVLLCVGVFLSVILSKRYVKPITDKMKSIGADGADSGMPKTHIQEIDLLIEKLFAIRKNDTPADVHLFESFIALSKTLTETELTVLRHHIDGESPQEILSAMYIAKSTLEKHNTSIFQKLNVHSKNELIVYADLLRQCGMLSELFPDSPKIT
jgi:DNA-binding CsgD family transcriptional regulator